MSDELKNFGMLIPQDVERWPDGTLMAYVRYKDGFIDWLLEKKINIIPFEGPDRDKLYLLWEKYFKNEQR